jgi:DNA polymerase
LSAKYDWVEHEQGFYPTYTKRGKLIENYENSIKYVNKAYRVFASLDENDGRLLKCKHIETGVKRDKFGTTPDHCFIENGDVRNMKIPDKLDRNWYIKEAIKRLNQFGVIV